jgi:DNA recombination protein RmuC
VETLDAQMNRLIQTNDQKLELIREQLEQRLSALQAENAGKLDQIQQATLSSAKTLREEVASL